MWTFLQNIFLKTIDFKIEDKKLKNSIKLEEAKKELKKTEKDFIKDLFVILEKLDVLKNVWNKAKLWTWRIIQIAWWEKREIKSLSDIQKDEFTKVVNLFKNEIFEWKKQHKDIFMKFEKDTCFKAFNKIDNFFSHWHEKYSEEDFIKIFHRRNIFLKELKNYK